MKAFEGSDADGFLDNSCAKDQEVLIQKAMKGNSRSFEALMSMHMKVVYNYILSHIPNASDAEDILQETMLSSWKSIAGYKNECGFRTWLLSITRFKIADYYRSQYHNKWFDSLNLSDIEETKADEKQADEFEQLSDILDITKALEHLSKSEQELVFFIFKAQLTYKEIEIITGTPAGTIKSRIFKIKAKLKPWLIEGRQT